MRPPFVLFDGAGPILATAIHAGHDLRPEVARLMALDEATRLREEDPYTDLLTEVVPGRMVVHRSRFEVDLNRPRTSAVYLTADSAWGLEVWRDRPSDETVAASLRIHDSFYGSVRQYLDQLALAGGFVVLDIHAYNHRRHGPDRPPAEPAHNPDINIGTGSLERANWEGLVDRFKADLAATLPGKTVEENIRFQGGHFPRWIHQQYPDQGCALAIEFKKTFMNEWDGTLAPDEISLLKDALARALPGVIDELRKRDARSK